MKSFVYRFEGGSAAINVWPQGNWAIDSVQIDGHDGSFDGVRASTVRRLIETHCVNINDEILRRFPVSDRLTTI